MTAPKAKPAVQASQASRARYIRPTPEQVQALYWLTYETDLGSLVQRTGIPSYIIMGAIEGNPVKEDALRSLLIVAHELQAEILNPKESTPASKRKRNTEPNYIKASPGQIHDLQCLALDFGTTRMSLMPASERVSAWVGIRKLAEDTEVSPHTMLGVIEGIAVEETALDAMLALLDEWREMMEEPLFRASTARTIVYRGRAYRPADEHDQAASPRRVWPDEQLRAKVLKYFRSGLEPWEVPQLAKALLVSPRTLERWCEAGTIPALASSTGGRGKRRGRWLIPDWLAQDVLKTKSWERKIAQGLVKEGMPRCPLADDRRSIWATWDFDVVPSSDIWSRDELISQRDCQCIRCRIDRVVQPDHDKPHVESKQRATNWRDTNADKSDLRESARWIERNTPSQADAEKMVAQYKRHAMDLPQLKASPEKPGMRADDVERGLDGPDDWRG